MVYRKNVLAARVELLQVSEVAGDFETATSLTFNRYSTYLQRKIASLPSILYNPCQIF